VTSLKHRTFNALKWSYLSFLMNMLLQPLFAAVLARLLGPKEFGLVAAGVILYSFGYFLADLGVGQALVQKRELREEHIRAAFTAAVVLGLLASVIAWMIAPAAANLIMQPEVIPIFRGYAVTYVLSTLVIVSMSLLRRNLQFKPIMLAEVSSYVLGVGVAGLGAAYLGYGAFSLVIAVAVQYVVQLAVTYAYARHSLKPIFQWAAYRDLFSFGSRASIIAFLEFLGTSLDQMVMVRLYDPAIVGVYNRAFNGVCTPLMGLARNLTRVLAPSFGMVQTDQGKLRHGYLTGLQALSVLMFSIAAGFVVCAPEIVMVLLGEKFRAAIPMVQVLGLFVTFPVLSNLAAVLAEATARLNVKIFIQLLYVAALAVGFWVAYRMGGGVLGFAWVLLVASVARNVAYAFVARAIIGGYGREIVRAHVQGLACACIVGLVLYAVVWNLRNEGVQPFALFAIEGLVGGLLLLLVALLGPSAALRTTTRSALNTAAARMPMLRSVLRS